MNFKEIQKLENSKSKNKVICDCSHVVLLGNQDRIICSFCGNWIYKDEKTKFKYKLMEEKIRTKNRY